MRKEKIYLDTSVVSAYFDRRNKPRQDQTKKFWQDIIPHCEVYISTITIKELSETKTLTLRRKLKNLTKNFRILRNNNEIEHLAKKYIQENIFAQKYFDDALHVAFSSYYAIP